MNSNMTAVLDNAPYAVVLYNNNSRKIIYQNSIAKKFMVLCDAYDLLSENELDSSFLAHLEKRENKPTRIVLDKNKKYSIEFIRKKINDTDYALYISDTSDLNAMMDSLKAECNTYKSLVQNAPSAICLFEWDGSTIKPKIIGEALEKILGYPEDIILQKNFNDFIKLLHSEDIFIFTNDVKTALYETKSLKSIYRIFNKPLNVYRHVYIEAVFISQPNGHIFINCSFTDVHEEREKSKDLQEINNQIKLLYEHIPGGIFTFKYNKYYTLIYANEEFYSYLGYNSASFKKLCNNRVSEIILDKDKEAFANLIRSRYQTQSKRHITLELQLKTLDNKLKWFSLSGQLMEDSDGNPYCYFVFFDIDEYKQVEQRQRRSIETIQDVLNTIKKGIVMYNDEQSIIFANKFASQYLGYDGIEEIVKHTKLNDLVYDDESYSKILNFNGTRSIKFSLKRKDGSEHETAGYVVSDKAEGETNILIFNK